MEEQKKWGGKRKGAGAPTKAEVLHTNVIILNAVKELNGIDNDDDARIAFAKDLLTFERGKMFVAEHLFGKPVQVIDQNSNVNLTSVDLNDLVKFK